MQTRQRFQFQNCSATWTNYLHDVIGLDKKWVLSERWKGRRETAWKKSRLNGSSRIECKYLVQLCLKDEGRKEENKQRGRPKMMLLDRTRNGFWVRDANEEERLPERKVERTEGEITFQTVEAKDRDWAIAVLLHGTKKSSLFEERSGCLGEAEWGRSTTSTRYFDPAEPSEWGF